MICTTLNEIRKSNCGGICDKLLKGLGNISDNEQIPFAKIVEICGIETAMRVFDTVVSVEQQYKFKRLELCFYMKTDGVVYEQFTKDWRFLHMLQIENSYKQGMATDKQFDDAMRSAGYAHYDIQKSYTDENIKEIFLEFVS